MMDKFAMDDRIGKVIFIYHIQCVYFSGAQKYFTNLKTLTLTEINHSYLNFFVDKEHFIFQKNETFFE